jgi:nitroreductase
VHQIIEDLNWRYATKRFDSDKKLSTEQLDILKESIRLAASSYGLQAFKVLLVENPKIREDLMVAAFGQAPVVEASHLFVFCANTEVPEEEVDAYMQRISVTRSADKKSLEPFSNGIKTALGHKSREEIIAWTSKQTYIALGQLLHTCASLKVDALPMEGFDPKRFDEILGLRSKGLTATLACPVGFRHQDDSAQFKKKVRKSNEELFETY